MTTEEKQNRATRAESTVTGFMTIDQSRWTYDSAQANYRTAIYRVYKNDDPSSVIPYIVDNATFQTNLDTIEAYLTANGGLPAYSSLRT